MAVSVMAAENQIWLGIRMISYMRFTGLDSFNNGLATCFGLHVALNSISLHIN